MVTLSPDSAKPSVTHDFSTGVYRCAPKVFPPAAFASAEAEEREF